MGLIEACKFPIYLCINKKIKFPFEMDIVEILRMEILRVYLEWKS